MAVRQVPGQHPQEDRGEIATVFYAANRRTVGEVFKIVTDDGFGKRLALDRGLEVLTTPSLAVQMVTQGALSEAEGKRVWRECTHRSRWNGFDKAIANAARTVPG